MFSSWLAESYGTKPLEYLPLLEPRQKAGGDYQILRSLGHWACLLVGGVCGAWLGITLLLAQSHHKKPGIVSPGLLHTPSHSKSHCSSPPLTGSFAAYHDVDRLLRKHESTRGSFGPSGDGYHKLYGSLFTPRRETAKLVVEVGVGRPGLFTWRDFFSKATVVGVDVDTSTGIRGEDRIVTVTGSDTTDPYGFGFQRISLYDHGINDRANILIDDGDHDPTMQARTMKNMYDILDDNGLYIVESFARKPEAIGGGHHFCGMPFQRPFVFGLNQANRRVRRDYIPQAVQDMIAQNDVFYATMEPTFTGNAMVMLKNWTSHRMPFSNMQNNYHVVYNALLSSVPIRALKSYRTLHGQEHGLACGSHAGIDVFIGSAKSGVSDQMLHDFHLSASGSFLFVEDISFSFCDGVPPPGAWGHGLEQTSASNPDWFYAMTDSDDVPDAKMLVLRKL